MPVNNHSEFINAMATIIIRGHAVTWLGHYATSWKVAGSISDAIGFINLSILSSRSATNRNW
jgi:hypothetical protein